MSEPLQIRMPGDESASRRGIALLGAGLRPFFLAAGFYAASGVTWWVAFLWGRLSLPTVWPSIWWHGHEMVFGFAGAAILYDTSNVLHHFPEDRYVGAALQLFASVALMFWYVLRLFMSSDD